MAGCILFFTACINNDLNKSIRTVDRFPLETGKVNIVFDSCLIKIDSTQQTFYKVSFVKDNYYYAYNVAGKALDIFDLKAKEFKHSVPFSGPPVSAIFVQSKDSIFLLSDKSITLINEGGKVLKELHINSNNKTYTGFFQKNYIVSDPECQTLFFDAGERKVYVHSIEPVYGTCSKKHFNVPILTSANIDSGYFRTIPVFFSNSYNENYYGFQVIPKFLFLDDKIIYNFPIDSRIFVYDKKYDSTIAFRPVSKISVNEATPVPKEFCRNDDKKLEYYITNVFFDKVIYSKALDQYFQFKRDAMNGFDKPKENGEYSTINDKKMIMSIFDKDLRFKAEVQLPKKTGLILNSFAVDSCIYIPTSKGKGSLYFSVLKIQQ